MTEIRSSDLEIVSRYTDQPYGLPPAVRARIAESWDGDRILLYALCDLDESLGLARIWLALGPRQIALVRESDDGGPPKVQSFERSRIRELSEARGLSCTVMSILGQPGEPALAVLRYTQRQRKAVENLCFVIERQLEGVEVETPDPDAEYVESLARPIRDAQALVAGRRIAVLWRLLSYLKPYSRQMSIGMSAATLLTVCTLFPAYVAGYLIDRVIEPTQAGLMTTQAAATAAWFAVAALGAVYVLRQGANFVRLRLMAIMGENVARDLRRELYDHMQSLSLSFFSRKKTGSLITRVTADTDRLWQFLALGVVDVSLAFITLIGLSAMLILLDWRLGLIMTLPVPVLCWGIWRHGERMNAMFLRAWRKWSRVTDVLSDTIPGMRVVKAFHAEEREKERFGDRNYDVTDEFNDIHRVWTLFWPGLVLTIHAMVITVWIFAIPRLIGTSDLPALTGGTFVSFLLYMTMFGGPIEIIGQIARVMNRATSSAHRVFEVLDTRPEVKDVPNARVLDPISGRVAFESVTFAYDGVRQILKGVSFEVKPGEMIGLVGPSGGGKTTITNLIARFYDASSGSVKIDGVDIREIDSGRFREQIGMVLQDPYLFHGTVLENITYGMPDATLDDAVEAAVAANAHDFICALPHGYDAMVGERGQTLSGGERQRVSIARAILHNPRILILDEATSSVDTETEWKIHEALSRLVQGRTVIAIAHRLSTLKRANRLFVVDDGRLTEQGTHEELLAIPDGTYRKLHNMQIELQEAV